MKNEFSHKGNILVVDDTVESLKLINDILNAEGYDVRPADSGELAIMAAIAKQPELILLDLKMPGMDGLEVCRFLKSNEKTRNIPVIFFSASSSQNERIEGLKLGAVDFISKPIQREELIARVKIHIELHRLRTELEKKVNDRTAELRKANEELQFEILEHKQLEEQIRLINQKNEDALSAVNMAHWEYDVNEAVFIFNDRFLSMHGLTYDEIVSYKMSIEEYTVKFVHPDSAKQISDFIHLALLSKEPETQLQTEGHLLKKGGQEFWVNIWFRTEKDENGMTIKLKGVNQDITIRKNALSLQKETETNYYSLYNNMIEGYAYCKMIYDGGKPLDFIYLDVNESFEKLTGLKNVIGKKVTDVIPGIDLLDAELFRIYNQVASTGNPGKFEYFLESLKVWFDVSVYSPQKEYFVAVFDVITERKKAEATIKAALKEKEALIRELYHRTKNNMQVISGFIELKKNSVTDPQTIEILREMEDRIMAFALVHQKLYQLQNLSRLDLKDYISDFTKLLFNRYKVSEEKITLELDLDSVSVLIDTAVPCGLILNELISNSIKYAFPGNMIGKIKVVLKKEDEDFIDLVIQDDGIGFNQETVTNNSIGLVLVKSISEDQLQGKMSFVTNNGSRYMIRFSDNLYEDRI